MKNIKAVVFALATLMTSGAQAVIIDFTKMADVDIGEKGFASFAVPGLAPFDLTITGTKGSNAAFAYLDKNKAGLGVCGKLDGSLQCDPPSDDNITGTAGQNDFEIASFIFDNIIGGNSVLITKIWLNNTHDPDRKITPADTLLVNGVSTAGPGNGYAPTSSQHNTASNYDSSGDNFLDNGGPGYNVLSGAAFTLGYGGTNPEQFYVSGMEVEVRTGSFDPPIPLPGTLLLLGSGLVGFALARRRPVLAL